MSLGDSFLSGIIGATIFFFIGCIWMCWRIRKKPYQDSTHTYTAVERSDNIE